MAIRLAGGFQTDSEFEVIIKENPGTFNLTLQHGQDIDHAVAVSAAIKIADNKVNLDVTARKYDYSKFVNVGRWSAPHTGGQLQFKFKASATRISISAQNSKFEDVLLSAGPFVAPESIDTVLIKGNDVILGGATYF